MLEITVQELISNKQKHRFLDWDYFGKQLVCSTASFYVPRSKSSRGNRQQKGYSSTTGRTEVEAETGSLTEQHCLFSKCIGMCILVYMCTVSNHICHI